MDATLQYLMEAQSYIDSFIDISISDAFFEDTEESKEIVKHNEEAKGGAVNALKKAFSAMINAIKNMISNITDFFQTRALSPEEKKRYAEFKQMVKSDPNFAKKTVTIADWKEYEKAYDEAVKEIEALANQQDVSQDMVDGIVGKLMDKISSLAGKGKDAGSRAALSVTLSTAVDIADHNVTCAKAINFALRNELISLQKIEGTLGEKSAAKFEKQIKVAAKNGIIHRAIVRIFKHKDRTFQAIIKKQFNNLLSFTNIKDGKVEKGKKIVDAGSLTRGTIKNHQLVVDTMGGKDAASNFAKNMATTAAKAELAKVTVKHRAKKKKKEWDDFKTFMGFQK